jgi:hypothetical protein
VEDLGLVEKEESLSSLLLNSTESTAVSLRTAVVRFKKSFLGFLELSL